MSINRLTDEFVVLTVRSNPEPMHPFFRSGAERTVVQTNARTPYFVATELFKVQRRVAWVGLQQREILAREQLHVRGKRIKALPETLRGGVPQSSRSGTVW